MKIVAIVAGLVLGWSLLGFTCGCAVPTGGSGPADDTASPTPDEDDMGTGSTLTKKWGWGQAGPLITGRTDKQVSMQAVFSPETAGEYTLMFNMSGNPASNNPIFAEALIIWSVEGHSVTRRVNVGDGISVTGVGQAVKVIMTDATSSIFGAPNQVEYQVACQVAPGSRGSNKQPPTLVPVHALGTPSAASGSGFFPVLTGNTTAVAIPQDAGVISVYITVGGATEPTPLTARVFHLYAGNPVKDYDPRDFPDWVPVTPGADQILLSNTSGETLNFTVTFGIDG